MKYICILSLFFVSIYTLNMRASSLIAPQTDQQEIADEYKSPANTLGDSNPEHVCQGLGSVASKDQQKSDELKNLINNVKSLDMKDTCDALALAISIEHPQMRAREIFLIQQFIEQHPYVRQSVQINASRIQLERPPDSKSVLKIKKRWCVIL
ncbi:MAG: hypothetical protein P4L31_02185 [Candidatus Babeliales bacterium]|nr:hypothetical protein [Candidatus Babeliales bacterium]